MLGYHNHCRDGTAMLTKDCLVLLKHLDGDCSMLQYDAPLSSKTTLERNLCKVDKEAKLSMDCLVQLKRLEDDSAIADDVLTSNRKRKIDQPLSVLCKQGCENEGLAESLATGYCDQFSGIQVPMQCVVKLKLRRLEETEGSLFLNKDLSESERRSKEDINLSKCVVKLTRVDEVEGSNLLVCKRLH